MSQVTLNLRDARTALKNAATTVASAVAEVHSAEESIGRIRVRIGMQYVTVRQVLVAQPSAFSGTWIQWANEHYKGGPDVYRLMQAGTVAAILTDAGKDLHDAGERNLVPLYRILKATEKGSDADQAKAQAKVLSVWTSLTAKLSATDKCPSEEKVLAAVDKATGTSGGTRGPKATGTAKGSTGKGRSTRKGRAAAPAKVEAVPEIGPDLSETELRTLGSKVRRVFGTVPAESAQSLSKLMVATCDLCKTYGTEAVRSAILSESREAAKSAKKAA